MEKWEKNDEIIILNNPVGKVAIYKDQISGVQECKKQIDGFDVYSTILLPSGHVVSVFEEIHEVFEKINKGECRR